MKSYFLKTNFFILILSVFFFSCNSSGEVGGTGEMILIPGGTINMGRVSKAVTIDSFYIGKYEVTQSEWTAVMGSNPSWFDACGGGCPVDSVSWYDALVFCNKKSMQDGRTPVYIIAGNKNPDQWGDVPTALKKSAWVEVQADWSANGYRLPTEAEWAYAAMGGSNIPKHPYSGSNTLDEVGWYAENSDSKTHAVGSKSPNGLGIFDMSGNVWEWCWDRSGPDFPYENNNPKGPDSGFYRILRGGGWNAFAGNCQNSFRSFNYPFTRSYAQGFRLVYSSSD